MAGRLIVEHLDDETLVYDTERNEAHALSGTGAAEFLAAEDEVSRRQVLRKLALAGAAAAGTGALLKTIVAPTAAQAQSLVCNPPCTVPGQICCAAIGGPNLCTPTANCCNGAICLSTVNACCNGVCVPNSNTQCGPTCQDCDSGGQICSVGVCITTPSDRNLKHHLAPVEPQDVLAAVG